MHLHILCSNVDATGRHIVASMETLEEHIDKSCILNVGDHTFVQKPSVIFYARMKYMLAHDLEYGLQHGFYKWRPRLREPILQRVLDGLCASDFVSERIRLDAGCQN